jgi:hypothetical protein
MAWMKIIKDTVKSGTSTADDQGLQEIMMDSKCLIRQETPKQLTQFLTFIAQKYQHQN